MESPPVVDRVVEEHQVGLGEGQVVRVPLGVSEGERVEPGGGGGGDGVVY